MGGKYEQAYQRKQDRVSIKKMAEDLERSFESIPKDTRYHIELRTWAYLSAPVFKAMEFKLKTTIDDSHCGTLLRSIAIKAPKEAMGSGSQ